MLKYYKLYEGPFGTWASHALSCSTQGELHVVRTEGRAERTLTAQFRGKGPPEVVRSKRRIQVWDRDFKTSLGNLFQ